MKRFLLLVSIFIITLFSCTKNNIQNEIVPPVVVDTLTISPDSIIINPSGYNPLAAEIKFTTAQAGKSFVNVIGKNGVKSNISHEFNDAGFSHTIPVIGLYANFLNTVKIGLLNDNGDTLAIGTVNIQTGALPPNMPLSITVDTANYDNMEDGLNLVSNFSTQNPYIPYMMDNYGDIRWLLDFSTNDTLKNLYYDCGLERLRNGNYFFGDQTSGAIYEVDMLGNIINRWSLNNYIFHHNVIEKPDGNFLVTVTDPASTHPDGSPTVEDNVLEINRQTGAIVNRWDLKESLDENRQALTTDTKDWIHENALIYDSSDNTIIVSGRTQGVVKLTYDNHIKWILGPHKGWGTNRRGEDLNQFLLTPLDALGSPITDPEVLNGDEQAPDFDWNWYQHCIILIPNGDMMMFDNGTQRNYKTSPTYSRALEVKIDPVNMTVQQIWAYGKDRGLETYSAFLSSVQYLPGTDHILFSPGYLVDNGNGKGGKIIELDYKTKQVEFQTSINTVNGWGFHRVYRISAYPN